MDVAGRFGDNLVRCRKLAGLSQDELSIRASVHRTEISQLERGLRLARIDTVAKLCAGRDALVFGRTPALPFDPKTLSDRSKRAWAISNQRESQTAEREGGELVLVRLMTLHECRHTFASLLIDAGGSTRRRSRSSWDTPRSRRPSRATGT